MVTPFLIEQGSQYQPFLCLFGGCDYFWLLSRL